jgi:hypothetical protein
MDVKDDALFGNAGVVAPQLDKAAVLSQEEKKSTEPSKRSITYKLAVWSETPEISVFN